MMSSSIAKVPNGLLIVVESSKHWLNLPAHLQPCTRANPVLQTHWGFRVMAVNRVVARNVLDGRKIDTSGDSPDGMWSSTMVRVNNSRGQAAILAQPKLMADRHAASNNGRTGIKLDWEVADAPENTEIPG